MAGNEALFHQKKNGRWEWLASGNHYFLGAVDGSICSFATMDEAAADRASHLAAPMDATGRRVRDKAEIVALLRNAAQEVGDFNLRASVVWHRRDGSGNNWYVHSDHSIAALRDIITLLQATYSIPDED